MKTLVLLLCVMTGFASSGTEPVQIGTYDSRAVAVAYATSTFNQDYLRALLARHKAAKAAGDKARMG